MNRVKKHKGDTIYYRKKYKLFHAFSHKINILHELSIVIRYLHNNNVQQYAKAASKSQKIQENVLHYKKSSAIKIMEFIL